MKIRQLAALLSASMAGCSIAHAGTQFVSVDIVHSMGNQMVITSLTSTSPPRERGMIFDGVQLSAQDGRTTSGVVSVELDLNGINSDDFANLSPEGAVNHVTKLFSRGVNIRTNYSPDSSPTKVDSVVGFRDLRLYSQNGINKTILSIDVKENLASINITDEPIPILWGVVAGIAALTASHYAACGDKGYHYMKIGIPRIWELELKCN